ncbi:hypothetical protein QBC43DRAFT_375178 [Cladorrhinum sp. PSN259]|nr:hypothetical protein QBC43DRAFT_375178 [Cladorrhinum sp. PSN259]
MRDLGSVCLRCQLRLLVAPAARPRTAPPRQTLRYNSTKTAPDDIRPRHNHAAPSPHPGNPRPRPSPNLAATAAERRANAVAMFKSIVGAPAMERPKRNIEDTSDGIELVRDVSKMQAMLGREDMQTIDAYNFFKETIYPKIQKLGADVSETITEEIGTILLHKLAKDKVEDFDVGNLPTVTHLTNIMIELNVLSPAKWGRLMLSLAEHICRHDVSYECYDSIKSFENAMAHREDLIRDLLGAWCSFTAHRPVEGPDDGEYGGLEARSYRKPDLIKAFHKIFRQYDQGKLPRVAWAAYATFRMMQDPINLNRSTEIAAAPFMKLMKRILYLTVPPLPKHYQEEISPYPELFHYLLRRSGIEDSGSRPARPLGQLRHDRLHEQLAQALKIRNVTAARKVWGEFWGRNEVPNPVQVKELTEHRALFDFFILAYMTMRRPSLAIEVWDKMDSIGIKPTIETWNSMMHGCAVTKNPDGIKAVWQKLITSDVKLDTAIWTARISGLFKSGDPDGALRALNEMAIVWNQRGKPEMANIAVKPSIEPVNAALAGLFRLQRDEDARRVLTWAASHNIKPDIFTFNTLLGPLLRRGDHAGVDGILSTMRSLKIDPDVTTFTVMLEGTLARVGSRDPAEQVAIVQRIMNEMKAAGIEANMITYAKMIYILLNEGDASDRAVQAVLAHIWSTGQELTSHIYTILVDHYFTHDPPDIGAVTSLIEKRQMKTNRIIDRIFWERVIRGYSSNGEVHRALDIFQNVVLPRGITRITFDTLHEFLSGLRDIQAWDAAEELVDYASAIPADDLDEKARGGQFPVRDEWLRSYRHRFWHLAYHMGLLKGEVAVRFRTAQSRVN